MKKSRTHSWCNVLQRCLFRYESSCPGNYPRSMALVQWFVKRRPEDGSSPQWKQFSLRSFGSCSQHEGKLWKHEATVVRIKYDECNWKLCGDLTVLWWSHCYVVISLLCGDLTVMWWSHCYGTVIWNATRVHRIQLFYVSGAAWSRRISM
jgi:hypothetical protein